MNLVWDSPVLWVVVGTSRESDGRVAASKEKGPGGDEILVEVPSFLWTAIYDPPGIWNEKAGQQTKLKSLPPPLDPFG